MKRMHDAEEDWQGSLNAYNQEKQSFDAAIEEIGEYLKDTSTVKGACLAVDNVLKGITKALQDTQWWQLIDVIEDLRNDYADRTSELI